MSSTYSTARVLLSRDRWSRTSLRSSLTWKARGQKNTLNGTSTRIDLNKLAGETGIVLRSPEGDEVECMVHLDFPTTNNEAEYETLVAGLDLVKAT